MIFYDLKTRLFEINNILYVASGEHDFIREGIAKNFSEVKDVTENWFETHKNCVPAKMTPIPIGMLNDEFDERKIVPFIKINA